MILSAGASRHAGQIAKSARRKQSRLRRDGNCGSVIGLNTAWRWCLSFPRLEVMDMSKSNDAKKSKMKQPLRTPEQKRKDKRDKKNKLTPIG